MKAKELDNMNQLIRKGNLVIDYDRIVLNFRMSIILDPTQKLKDYEHFETAELDKGLLSLKVIKDLDKAKYKLSLGSWQSRLVSLGTSNTYRGRALITKQCSREDTDTPVITLRSDLPKSCQCQSLIAELAKEHTILEWFQLKRRIRRHFRKCMNEGKMDSALKRMDEFKVHKSHDKLSQDLVIALDKVIASLVEPVQAIEGLPEQLQPFVQVSPYSDWFNQLSYIQSHIQDAKEWAEKLKEAIDGNEDD
jgi:hypothetical protein